MFGTEFEPQLDEIILPTIEMEDIFDKQEMINDFENICGYTHDEAIKAAFYTKEQYNNY